MHLEITFTSHNRVDWVVRTKILWIEISLILGVLVAVSLLASTASPIRWRVITILIAIASIIAGILAATTPVIERGFLERLPDGGELVISKFWIPIGPRKALMLPVDDILGFRYEVSVFQDSEEDRYPMARLWVIRKVDSPQKVTGWLDPEGVDSLGDALAKACRCEYDRGDTEIAGGIA
jgi:hypothetical protein